MARQRISRLPQDICDIFEIYQRMSGVRRTYPSKHVQQYLRKSSQDHLNFQQYKLLLSNTYDKEDFPPLLSHSIKPIFKTRLQMGPWENLEPSELFKVPVEQDSIDSESRKTVKRFTDFEAKIIQTLQSHFDGHGVPTSLPLQRAFKWYLRLLRSTPLFLVLRQDNRLFSDSSLQQINYPIQKLKHEVNQLGLEWSTKSPDVTRTYHLADLSNTDIFSTAIKTQNCFDTDNVDQPVAQFDWSHIPPVEDMLIGAINQNKCVELVDKNGSKVSEEEIAKFWKMNPPQSVLNSISLDDASDVFPFDLQMSTFYLLCIEQPIIESDHTKLFDLIENSSLDVVGARISLTNPHINKFFRQDITTETEPLNLNYNELLKIAEKSHHRTTNPLEATMERLGELGLTEVEKGCHNNCIYLLPKP